ncbi:MAG: hypothetical protein Q8J64_05065 [Thermodesulfovibrionales bacterium]|nr:hypothetical protein [Thermodesulfovibrionales bacterium]
MNILWVSGAALEGLWGAEISKRLAGSGFNVVFLTNMKQTYAKLKEAGCDCHLLSDIAIPHKKAFTGAELQEIERKYEYPGFNNLRSADETISGLPMDEANSIVASYYLAVEGLFEKYGFGNLIMFPTSAIQGRVPYSVAKGRGARTLIPYWGPVHNDMFVILDVSEEWIWSELFSGSLAGPGEAEIKSVISEIEKKLLSARQPSSQSRIQQAIRISLNCLRYLRSYKRDYDFAVRARLAEMKKDIRSFSGFFRKYLFRHDEFIPEGKYVFFPLHCHFDAALQAANPMFTDQCALVKNTAKSLPVGYTLYVKEHPYDEGYLKISQLKELRRMGNVKILHPAVRSIHILKNASAVVTISSSAGWEAFLFKKPVVAFGSSFYAECDLIYKVNAMKGLKDILWEALKKGESIYSERDGEYMSFIGKIIADCRPGNACGYKSSFGWGFDSKKDAELIAAGLLSKLQAEAE